MSSRAAEACMAPGDGRIALPALAIPAPAATYGPVLLVACAGVATAFFRLGARGLWGDEVWQVRWSQQQTLTQTVTRFRAPPDFPLQFLLVHLSTALGSNPFWARLPSAILGAATVVLLFLLGRRLFDTAIGLAAALLLAVAPYHVWYAQDARPYAGLAFYALLSLYFFVLVLQRPSVGAATGFTLATVLDLYNHLFGLFPLLVEVVAAIIWAACVIYRPRARGEQRRRARLPELRSAALLGAGTIVSIIAAAPLLAGLVAYILNRGAGTVVGPPFRLTPSFVQGLFSALGSGSGWALWLMATLCAVGLGVGVYRRQPIVLLAAGWLALPLLVLGVSGTRHVFSARYLLFMQPVYLLMVASGLVIAVDGVLLARSRPHVTSGQWPTLAIALPPRVGGTFLVDLHNPGPGISAFSMVEVRYRP